jgi:hypothetical protein
MGTPGFLVLENSNGLLYNPAQISGSQALDIFISVIESRLSSIN